MGIRGLCDTTASLIDFKMGSEKRMTRGQFPQILSCFFLFLLVLHIKPGDAHDAASNTIVLGSSLTGNQTRISKDGIFKLGFFNLKSNNVKKWYVGIWYAQPSHQTIAWVSNVDQLLQNASNILNLRFLWKIHCLVHQGKWLKAFFYCDNGFW